jgi:hypothetical protein
MTIEVEAELKSDQTNPQSQLPDQVAGQATAIASCPETDMLSTNYSNICKHDNTSNFQVGKTKLQWLLGLGNTAEMCHTVGWKPCIIRIILLITSI